MTGFIFIQQNVFVTKASATNVFCAKAKRQLQMFSVRKRSDSNKMFSVAKAKRQLQMFSVRKRSDSNNYAKAKLINRSNKPTSRYLL
ncbi:hypothetical protein [Lysinibacillus sp. RS5]|uniref:hypothetical protein n=1 Tax=unclassified Lysinibacillus TaxID=2636778 RepID=UPI0035BE7D4F